MKIVWLIVVEEGTNKKKDQSFCERLNLYDRASSYKSLSIDRVQDISIIMFCTDMKGISEQW